jgi:hypothetical protein
MKKILKILVLALFFTNCKAQTEVDLSLYNHVNENNKYFKDLNNYYGNFIGTWENTSGNRTFRLILWKKTKEQITYKNNSYLDEIAGRFLIILNAGTPNEQVIHNSVKYYPQNNVTSESILFGTASNNNSLFGVFQDTCASLGDSDTPDMNTVQNQSVLGGWFSLIITNIGNNPSTANWKISSERQLRSNEFFSFPTECVMTKIN